MKPVPIATLRERIGKRRSRSGAAPTAAWRSSTRCSWASEFEGIVGRSPLMWICFSRIRRIAPHYRTVLTTGETGTGKIWLRRRCTGSWRLGVGTVCRVELFGVVETLFESELFGHVRGSSTGAAQDKTA